MSEVIARIDGKAGHISLHRPKAIHALTRDMCTAMIEALLAWRDDPVVKAVMIDHDEGRGFCAGGDVRMLADSGKSDGSMARAFFHEGYRLNHLLFTYRKKTVVFMDGVTMGGGVGISMPCKYRVATENTRFAMPETAIGLFPDVGGGWYLSRLPGRVGQFLALTGARLDGAECHYLGLATHYIPHESLADVKEQIAARPERIEGILGKASVTPPAARIADNLVHLNKTFASDNLEEILDWDTGQVIGQLTLHEICEVKSHQEPLIQAADLFAGLGVYSRRAYKKFSLWRSEGMPTGTQDVISNADEERFEVLGHFYSQCKKHKLGVSLNQKGGLRTFNPAKPINFWWYEPQGGYDKAPT